MNPNRGRSRLTPAGKRRAGPRELKHVTRVGVPRMAFHHLLGAATDVGTTGSVRLPSRPPPSSCFEESVPAVDAARMRSWCRGARTPTSIVADTNPSTFNEETPLAPARREAATRECVPSATGQAVTIVTRRDRRAGLTTHVAATCCTLSCDSSSISARSHRRWRLSSRGLRRPCRSLRLTPGG